MKTFIFKWFINALALSITAYFVKGIEVSGMVALILAAGLLGVLNAIIRPVVLLLTLPINILTLGLFTLIINGTMLWLVSALIKGFSIHGFWPAIWGALILSIISAVLNWLIK